MCVIQHTDESQMSSLQTDNRAFVTGIDKSNIPIQWPFSELLIPPVPLLRSPAQDPKHKGSVHKPFDKPPQMLIITFVFC